MTDFEYRTLPRIANSDLTDLAGRLFKKKMIKASPETLLLGSRFHRLILEPDTLGQNEAASWGPEDYFKLVAMRASLVADSDLVADCENAERETVRQWTHTETGLLLKGKLDICVLPRRRHLIDLKTTSCRTLADFEETVVEYNYDRQAAFYLDSDRDAQYFEFVGVEKNPPYKLYKVLLHRDEKIVAYGRKKMNVLLRQAQEEFSKPNGWRPASWSRKEVLAV